MKKITLSLLAIATLMGGAFAQNKKGGMKPKQSQQCQPKGQAPAPREQMIKNLNLTPTQQEQLKANHESYQKQLAVLDKNESITVKEARDKRESLHKEEKEKMKGLLTEEQKNKLAENEKGKEAEHKAMSDKKMEQMKTHLNLSDEQVAKIKANRDALQAQHKAIKDNDQLTRAQKREQMKALQEQSQKDLKAILTPEQAAQMKDHPKKDGSEHGDHR